MRGAVASPRLEPFELSRVDLNATFFEIDRHRIEGLPMFDGAFTDPEGVRGALGGIESDRPIAWIKVNPNAEAQLRKARERSGLHALIAVTMGQHPGLCPVNAAFFSDPFGPPVLQVSSEELPALEKAAESGADVRIVCGGDTAAGDSVQSRCRRSRQAAESAAGVRDDAAQRLVFQRVGARRRAGVLAGDAASVCGSPSAPDRAVRGFEWSRAGPPWTACLLETQPDACARRGRLGSLRREHRCRERRGATDLFGQPLESDAIRALTPYDLDQLTVQPACAGRRGSRNDRRRRRPLHIVHRQQRMVPQPG